MPRRSNRKENQSAKQRMPAPQMRQIPRHQQIHRNDQQGKNKADQSLGQHAQSACGRESSSIRTRRLGKRAREAEHRDREPETHNHIRNQNAGEDEQPEAGREHE
jgi:hypothetical protein